MKWNYRLMRSDLDNTISIHEVHYDTEGKVNAWTGPMPITVFPDDDDFTSAREEVFKIMDMIRKDLESNPEVIELSGGL